MKIQRLLIEHCGALRNFEVSGLPDGLTVFIGPNGAGKSTLFAFLRQMLFGRARADAEGPGTSLRYASWGGSLHCAGSDGIYTITCKADQPSQLYVTRPDGGEGGEAALDRLFGGADGRLIASLLAFDVLDLQALPPLSAPGVRERFAPVGVGRIRSIQRALDTIEARKSEIARRAGGDPRRLPALPVEVQVRLDDSTRAAARLGQLLQAQAQARLTLDLRTRTISDLKAEGARYSALVDLSAVWQELAQARRELESTEPVDEFPADAEERLAQALIAREAARRSVEQLDDHEGQAPRGASAAFDVGMAGTAHAGFDTVVRQRVRLEEGGATGTDHEQAPVGDSAIACQQRWKEAAEAVCHRERELDTTIRAIRELERGRTETSATLSRPEPPSAAALDEGARLVQHVRTTLAALADDQASTTRWQETIAECSRTIRTVETQVMPLPSQGLARAAWVAAGLGMTAAAWHYAAGELLTLSVLVVCSFAGATGAVVQRARRASAFDENASCRARLATLRSELEEACQNLLRHQEHAARSRFDISVDCLRLGLPPMPSEQQLQQRQAEVEGQRRQRDDRDKAQTALAETLASLTRSEELRRQHLQALQAAQTLERQTIQQWHQWRLHAIDNIRAARGTGETTVAEAALLENCRRLRIQIAECEQNAIERNTRAGTGLLEAGEFEAVAAMGALAGQAGRYLAQNTHPGNTMVAQASDEYSPALEAARGRLRHCEEALAQLFSQGGVSDEAAFRDRLTTYRRRLALRQTIRACESRSNERLKGDAAADAILRELPEGRVEEWRRRVARTAQELADLEGARDEVQRQICKLEADLCVASAESADLPVLEVERSGSATDARTTLGDWRTLTIAASLLAEARRRVERECMPPALRRASETLSAVTFSRYERLAHSEDQRELHVFDVKSGWKAVNQLSRGTVEQLHFSLRLGLADEPTEGGPWPLVIDDALDHFDPARGRAMASQVIELSRRHQVFVFTRRPETCDLLRSLDPTANVVAMQEV